MDKLKDAHFFPLSSQGNIYTLTNLQLANGTNKLLVASLRREVFCFELQDNAVGMLIPSTKEISFTYIPSGADIISLDAFNKSEIQNDFVIGITIIKSSNDSNSLETYLNIYSEWEASVDFNIESISQNCLNIELKYIPYQLSHTYLITFNENEIASKEVVFLLSGSDQQIHIYRENQTTHIYKEIDYREHFPEFYKLPSVVLWLDIHYFNNNKERLTAIGCECGYIRLCRVCVQTSKIIFNYSTRFDNTVCNVRIYREKTVTKPLSFTNGSPMEDTLNQNEYLLNLVVTNTILPAVFFKDVLNHGLKKYGPLPRYEVISVISTTEIADLDLDGCEEILMGASNQEIALYKYDNKKGWCLEELKKFPAPIIGIKYVDISGDGVKELVVLTIKGIHILQHEASCVQRALEEKVKNLTIPDIGTIKLEN